MFPIITPGHNHFWPHPWAGTGFAPTANTANVVNSIPVRQEPPKKTSSYSERTNNIFNQIQYLLGEATKHVTEGINVDEVKTVQYLLSHLKVHIDGLHTFVDQRDRALGDLEAQLIQLRSKPGTINRNAWNIPPESPHQEEEEEDEKTDTEVEKKPEVAAEKALFSMNNAAVVEESEESEDESAVAEKATAKRPARNKRKSPKEFTLTDSEEEFAEYIDERPQKSGSRKRRGKLPELATSLLKGWILDHRFHPYPSEEEKAMLCQQTNLTLNQINNWFTNARRRLLPKTAAAEAAQMGKPSAPKQEPQQTVPYATVVHAPSASVVGSKSQL